MKIEYFLYVKIIVKIVYLKCIQIFNLKFYLSLVFDLILCWFVGVYGEKYEVRVAGIVSLEGIVESYCRRALLLLFFGQEDGQIVEGVRREKERRTGN